MMCGRGVTDTIRYDRLRRLMRIVGTKRLFGGGCWVSASYVVVRRARARASTTSLY